MKTTSKISQVEKGFTLVEVLASILIISIIFLGVAQLIAFTNKTAVSNNSKLVTTHLAKATIERIKIEPETYFALDELKTGLTTYSGENCKPDGCEDLYEFIVNDQTYEVEVKISQTDEEKELNLVNVIASVKQKNKKIQSVVEGYVIDETFEQ